MATSPLDASPGSGPRLLFSSEPLLGGMNSRVGADAIAEAQAAELVNVSLDDPSRPRKREGYRRSNVGSLGMRQTELRIAKLEELDLGPGTRLMVAMAPGDGGGVYVTVTPSSTGWSEATAAGTPLNVGSDDVVCERAHDALWIMPSSGRNLHALKPDGTLVDAGNENGSPPREIRAMAYGLARMMAVTRDRIYFSKVYPSTTDLEEKTAFNRAVDFIPLEPGAGASYVAATFWRDQSLIVFADTRIDRVAVDPADPLNSSRHTVESEYGCSAPGTVVSVGDSLYFLDQFLEFRELRQTIQASVAGVSPTPVSDPIRTELSLGGRINEQAARRSFCVVNGERVLLFYPRDASVDPNYVAVWNTRLRAWEGIWQLGHPMSSGIMSNIDGSMRLYTTNGDSSDPLSMLYEWGGVYADDGLPITYRETTRAYVGQSPMQTWVPDDVAFSVHGDVGAKGLLMLRTDANGALSRISEVTVTPAADTDFPILDSDFPILDTDFPLVDATPQVVRQRTTTWSKRDADVLPAYAGVWPLYAADFPLFDTGYGVDPGPMIQARIEETSTKAFTRMSYAVVATLIDQSYDAGYASNEYA